MPKWDSMTPAYSAILEGNAREIEKYRYKSARRTSKAPVTLSTVAGVDYNKPGKPSVWTEAQEEMLVEMVRGGIAVATIAENLDKRPQAVRVKMKELGIPRPYGNQTGCAARVNTPTKYR